MNLPNDRLPVQEPTPGAGLLSLRAVLLSDHFFSNADMCIGDVEPMPFDAVQTVIGVYPGSWFVPFSDLWA